MRNKKKGTIVKSWGKHYLLDCAGCSKELITSKNHLIKFTKELISKIDMIAYGEPILEHFALHDPLKGGYTLCQMISTSLIDGHFVDATGEAYISIHSCKDFDTEIVKQFVYDFFKPSSIIENIIYRQA